MIDVNIWLSTTVLLKKRITHGIFGPLLASESASENVGHANLTLDVNETAENYEYVETHFGKLNPKKTLSIIPTPVIAEENWSHLAPKTVKSYVFTHSMWPKGKASATGIFKRDTKRTFHLGSGQIGVEAEFNTHDNDMMREDTSVTAHVVKHKKPCAILIQSEKQKNMELLSDLSSLEVNFENLAQWQKKLEQLQLEKAELIARAEDCASSHKNEVKELQLRIKKNTSNLEKIDKQLVALERTRIYLNKIEHKDPATEKQFLSIQEQIKNLKQEQKLLVKGNTEVVHLIDELKLIFTDNTNKINEELKQNKAAINYYVEAVEKAQKEINGRTIDDLERMREESRKRVDYTSRKEQFLLTHEKTEGRHPDHIIKLPVKSDGWDYFVDEIKILEAMQQERSANYSFIFNNCSTSVKRCLLAGIDEPLRAKLMETGLKESFFKLNRIETCKGLRDWARTLEAKLIAINFPPLSESKLAESGPTHSMGM